MTDLFSLGANRSKLTTKIYSLGRRVPTHDEEWDGDLPLLHTDAKQTLEDDTDGGEVMFIRRIYYIGEQADMRCFLFLDAVRRMMIANDRDRFDITRMGNTMSSCLFGRYRFIVRLFFSRSSNRQG